MVAIAWDGNSERSEGSHFISAGDGFVSGGVGSGGMAGSCPTGWVRKKSRNIQDVGAKHTTQDHQIGYIGWGGLDSLANGRV